MKTLLIFLTISQSLLADDCVDCTSELKPFDAVVKNIEALQAPATVNCEEVLKNNAKAEYQDLFGKLPKQKKIIKGLKLEGSAEELKFLSKMLGEKPNDKWKMAKECKTVLCALTTIYDSEETAQRVLNIAKRDGYIVSVGKDFNDTKGPVGELFSPAEIKDIDLAYKILPPSYKKLSSMDKIKRMPHSYSSPRSPNAAAYASPSYHSSYLNYHREGEITFVDGAFNSDKSWGPSVAVHELSHHVDFSSNKETSAGISESSAFLKISGWQKKNVYQTDKESGKKTLVNEWQHAKDKKFVRDYAGTQPAEDFAESCAYYIYNPLQLKAIDPEKYDFLKKIVFKGKEYLSEIELPTGPGELLRSCINARKEYNMYGANSYLSPSITPSCLNDFYKDFKFTDPKLCSFNIQQIKNSIFDTMAPQVKYLNEVLVNCDTGLPLMEKECINENDYQKDCPALKFYSKNTLSSEKLNLSAEDTKKIQDEIAAKTHLASYNIRSMEVMSSIVSKRGQSNVISEILIHGLSEKNKVSNQYSLTIQKYFLDNAITGLSTKLTQEGYKFDKADDLKQMSQYYLLEDKKTNAAISSFQDTVLKKATKSKEKNLELIKAWASSQSLEDTPMFNDLAESIRKYGGIKLPW